MTAITTLERVMADGRARLRAADVPSAALDARVLASHSFDMSVERLIRDSHMPVAACRLRRYTDSLERRAGGEPVAYITGYREFWSMRFAVAPGCLVPRPDSEALICALLEAAGTCEEELRILDLGTGTGCLLLALLSELTRASGTGTDADWRAVRAARENARSLGLGGRATFIQGDWASAVAAPFDLIVTNPPYIPSADITGLPRDIREYEPMAALDGGPDGLDSIRTLMVQIRRLLAPRGIAALEFGPGQANAVEELARRTGGFGKWRLIHDLAGRRRGILLHRQGN